MSDKLKKIIKAVSFVLVFCAIFAVVQPILVPNRDWPSNDRRLNKSYKSMFQEQKDSLDVLWSGSSHLYQSISPMEIYRESGIRSYDIGAPSQPIPVSYYKLKAAMKKQSPKVVALDAGALFQAEGTFKAKVRWQESLDMLPLSFLRERIEMAADLARVNEESFDDEYLFRSVLPLMLYHDNYVLAEEEYYDLHTEDPYYRKGYVAKAAGLPAKDRIISAAKVLRERPVEGEFSKTLTARLERTRPYLDKLMALCQEHGSQLLLVKVPLVSDGSYSGYWSSEKHAMVQQVADELGIRFLDLNDVDLGIDWKTDTKDEGIHLNLSGATKVSRYMAGWLQDAYGLSGSDDAELRRCWDYQLALYDWEMSFYWLKMEDDLSAYMDKLAQGNYTLLTAVSGNVGAGWSDALQAQFETLTGTKLDLRDPENAAYVCHSAGGAVVEEHADPDYCDFNGRAGEDLWFTLRSQAGDVDNSGNVILNYKEMASSGRGIHFVVIDNDLQCVVESVCFKATEGGYKAVRGNTEYTDDFRVARKEYTDAAMKRM